MEVTIQKYKCLKCGYDWIPRVPHPPKECPHCKRYGYDKPGKNKEEVIESEKKMEIINANHN